MIKDPPLPIDPESMGLTPVGVKLIEHNGVVHIFDWVGEGYYPYVSDFIEEVRRFGASRRLPQTLDFSRLSPMSRLILLHSRALVPAFEESVNEPQVCPHLIKAVHDRLQILSLTHTCANQWWADHDATGKNNARLLPGEPYEREMPSFTYVARQQPGPYIEPAQVGIFMVLPISRIAVVRDPSTGSHEGIAAKIVDKLLSSIPLQLVDE